MSSQILLGCDIYCWFRSLRYICSIRNPSLIGMEVLILGLTFHTYRLIGIGIFQEGKILLWSLIACKGIFIFTILRNDGCFRSSFKVVFCGFRSRFQVEYALLQVYRGWPYRFNSSSNMLSPLFLFWEC